MRVCGLRLVRQSHKVSHRFSAFAWQVIISFALIVCTCIKMVNWNDYLNRGWFEPVFIPRTSRYSVYCAVLCVLVGTAFTICATSEECTTRDEHSKKSIFNRKKCAEKNSTWMVRVKSAKKIEIWSIEAKIINFQINCIGLRIYDVVQRLINSMCCAKLGQIAKNCQPYQRNYTAINCNLHQIPTSPWMVREKHG